MSGDREPLRETLLNHHPVMRSLTGPLAGCRCGEVGLGEDVIQHVMEKLLDGPLAPLLDAAFTVNRVEALANDMHKPGSDQVMPVNDAATMIREALRGDQ